MRRLLRDHGSYPLLLVFSSALIVFAPLLILLVAGSL